MTGRSPAAKKHRAIRRAIASESGRRIACDVCKHLHEPPACPIGAEPVQFTLHLPPHVDRAVRARIEYGTRSAWLVRLIRRELGV